ncbi:hypothetical protein EB169_05345 [archaeon]|nr:hypothetical protein [archaeon]
MTTANAANTAFKVHIENMPEALNTKKDVDEYCKQFWKDYKEKAKEKKAAKAEKPKRKKGVDKDGNPKEKRAPSAYNIFVKEKYAEIKEANPDMDKTEIFAEIAKLWQGQKAENAKAPSNEEKEVSDKKSPEKKEENEKEEIMEVVEAPKKKPGRKAIVKKAKKTSPEEAQEEASE